MRATAKALKTYFSSFGIPAYTVDTIPKDVSVPYLVYPLSEPEWNQKSSFYVQGWYRSTSNAALATKADEIVSAIGTGIKLDTGVGYVSIYPESPLVQMITDGDYRSFYINLSLNAYQMPGAFPVQPIPSTETPVTNEETQEPGETPEEGE